MKKRFYLVRHGKKELTIGDPGLSDLGKKQAQATRDFLKGKKIDFAFSSPLKRCIQTAKIISAVHKAGLVIDDSLRERVNWGDLPGQTFEDFVNMWESSNHNRTAVPRVGDSPEAAGKRLEKFLRNIYLSNPKSDFLIVSHGGIITDFLINIFPSQLLEERLPGLTDEHSYKIKEGSITTVDFDGTVFSVIDIGLSSHLPEV